MHAVHCARSLPRAPKHIYSWVVRSTTCLTGEEPSHSQLQEQMLPTSDIVALVNQGRSQREIASRLGVSQSYISTRLKKHRLEGEKGPDAEKADDTDETDSKHAMED